MKTSKFFALAVIFLTLSSFRFIGLEVKGAQVIRSTDDTNYVVIGAFSIQRNAIRFTSSASKKNLDAKYAMNQNRNLYYVYVLSTNNHQQAIEEALRLRKDSPYNDTWVYHGSFAATTVKSGTDINPVTQQPIQAVAEESSQVEAAAMVGVPQSATSTVSEQAEQGTTQESIAQTKKEETSEPAAKKDIDTETSGKSFYFKIFRGDDQQPVEGDVNVIDAERSRKIGTFAGNTEVRVTDPNNKEGGLSLVCEVFGFRKVQRDIKYETPEGEGITNENNATVVPFELVRLQKGDIAVMYNVYFFKDAAVMRPESRYEVTSLLNMLNENPKYKIKIHGHTNGGAAGKIISMKEGSDNFFSLNDTKEGVGSAKKLSEVRAEIIRDFLKSNGIAENRMQVKAWGGKRPVYDKHSPQAQSNVRVEIEILEN
ncbi:MAG: OmpA family protein [Cyclobacteriaceae bacterium]